MWIDGRRPGFGEFGETGVVGDGVEGERDEHRVVEGHQGQTMLFWDAGKGFVEKPGGVVVGIGFDGGRGGGIQVRENGVAEIVEEERGERA